MKPVRIVAPAAALACLLLTGCNDESNVPAAAAPAPAGPAQIGGQVVKGVTRNALVSVFVPDGSGGLTQLGAPVLSSADGAFAMTLPVGYEGVVKVVASATSAPDAPTEMRCDADAGCGAFAAPTALDVDSDGNIDFGEWFPVGSDFSLRAVGVIDGGGLRMMNLTPLSTLAADWAEKFPQGLDARSVLAANTQTAVTFGFESSDLERALGDITDPLWVNIADEKQLKLALFMATFAEVATSLGMGSIDCQDVIEMYAQAFADNNGRLLEDSTALEPTLSLLLGKTVMLAGTLDVPAASLAAGRLSGIQSSINSLLAGFQGGRYSLPPETTAGGFLDRLGPLGDDIAELVEVTGIDHPVALANAQKPYFEWLLVQDNLQIVPVAVETVLYSLIGSAVLDYPMPLLAPDVIVLASDLQSSIKLKRSTKQLLVTGIRHGQTLDLAVTLTPLKAGVAAKRFAYGITGTLANGTAHGSIDGTLGIDTGDTDLDGLVALIPAPGALNTNISFDALKGELLALAQTANGTVTLSGDAVLVRNSNPEQQLGGHVVLTGSVDLGAAAGETIATLDVSEGEIRLPNGDRFYGLAGKPVLTVNVSDDATLVLDGGAVVLGLPPATAHAEGELVNARALFEHVQNTLVSELGKSTVDLQALVTALLDFDLSQMAIHGEGVVDIPGMPSGRDHQYRARLDNLTATVYQPHSDEVALSATLDPERQRVAFTLGSERWEARAMTTPTPRMVMLGPDGQYAEVSQEDFYAMLDSLPLGSLFAGLGLGGSAPATP